MKFKSLEPVAVGTEAVALSLDTPACRVMLQADPGDPDGAGANEATVYFGSRDGQPHKLNPGDSTMFEITNLNEVLVSGTDGDHLLVSYWVRN